MQLGWIYGSITEDILTGFKMHCRGWRSIYCMPKRAAFKGSAPINLSDRLNQVLRWALGSVEIFFSRHSLSGMATKVANSNGLSVSPTPTQQSIRSHLFHSLPTVFFQPSVSLPTNSSCHRLVTLLTKSVYKSALTLLTIFFFPSDKHIC